VIGLFGGAFDPPHDGHVALLRAGHDALRLDGAVVIVTEAPGHKLVETPPAARLELARAAFPGVQVVLDGHPRTVDMLRGHPEWEGGVFLLGADEFAGFLGWKEPEEVLRLVSLGVATRPGFPRESLDAVLARLDRPGRASCESGSIAERTSMSSYHPPSGTSSSATGCTAGPGTPGPGKLGALDVNRTGTPDRSAGAEQAREGRRHP